jgi:hypothetical protein
MVRFAVIALMSLAVAGCFKGAEREKKAPPGIPGGLCLAPDGHCTEGICNQDRNYCYDGVNPCKGFFCGGSDRGTCIIDTNSQPSCQCGPGFENRTFELYCCPDEGGGDIDCINAQSNEDEESSG